MGNGQREFALVAASVMNDFAVGGELGQGGADFSGANATDFLQLLNRDRLPNLGERLAHPFRWGGRSVRLNRGVFHHPQGHARARFGELKWDVISGRGGAMFGGQGQLGAFAASVEIGVAPAVEFAGTPQGLARSAGLGVFAGVMNHHDGQLELPLEFP